MHKLGKCFIDYGLIFIVLVEDEIGKFLIMMHQIQEWKDNMMFRCIECIPSRILIFDFPIHIPKFLDKSSELSFNIVTQSVLWQLVHAINLHGA